MDKTFRGFAIEESTDLYGLKYSIQKSSLATDDAIWLGLVDADPQIMASDAKRLGLDPDEDTGWVPYEIPKEVLLSTRMHLNREMVAKLLPILTKFVETGEID